MKFFFLPIILATSITSPVFALTPETVNEYYSAPTEGLAVRFTAQAVKVQNANGIVWKIKLRTSAIWSVRSAIDWISVNDAKVLLETCKLLTALTSVAEASSSDMYEKRIGINETLDVMYRHDKSNNPKETFWLLPPNANMGEGLELQRDAFEAMIKTLSVALNKVEK